MTVESKEGDIEFEFLSQYDKIVDEYVKGRRTNTVTQSLKNYFILRLTQWPKPVHILLTRS